MDPICIQILDWQFRVHSSFWMANGQSQVTLQLCIFTPNHNSKRSDFSFELIWYALDLPVTFAQSWVFFEVKEVPVLWGRGFVCWNQFASLTSANKQSCSFHARPNDQNGDHNKNHLSTANTLSRASQILSMFRNEQKGGQFESEEEFCCSNSLPFPRRILATSWPLLQFGVMMHDRGLALKPGADLCVGVRKSDDRWQLLDLIPLVALI